MLVVVLNVESVAWGINGVAAKYPPSEVPQGDGEDCSVTELQAPSEVTESETVLLALPFA